MKNRCYPIRIGALLLAFCLTAGLFAGCAPSKNEGIQCAETYLNHLIQGEYDAAYDMLSDYDKSRISREIYLLWKEQVAQIITIKSAAVETKVDKFPDYKYQGTAIGYALGLKISREQDVLIAGIELDGYNQPTYRQMVVYESGQWKMLLLLGNLDEIVAGYASLLKKTETP